MEQQVAKENIRTLIELQRVESEIRVLDAELAGVDARLEAMEGQREEARAAADAAGERVVDLKKRYREMDGEVRQYGDRMDKSREKLRAVKTNKEYQAGLREIDEMKREISRLEDGMLGLLDEIDAAETDREALGEEAGRIADRVRVKQETIRDEASSQRRNMADLRAAHEQICARIDDALLRRFTAVKQGQADGRALVPVHNATCRGCNVNIPPQMYNELHRGDSLRHCPNCQRLVYWEDL